MVMDQYEEKMKPVIDTEAIEIAEENTDHE